MHSTCYPHRMNAIAQISKIGQVFAAGNCGKTQLYCSRQVLRPLGYPGNPKRHLYFDNPERYSHYRFGISMENKKYPGYVTEKILMAFLGGTIPIYYGTRDVFHIFNKDAFVYYDCDDPAPALAQIAYLERNHTAYLEMLTANSHKWNANFVNIFQFVTILVMDN